MMIYKLNPTKNQKEELELIIDLESKILESVMVESIEFFPTGDFGRFFKVTGYWYDINSPENKSYEKRYYFKPSLVYDSLYKWMNPYIRNFKIKELLDDL